jgi:hypothetical protein
MFQGSTNLVFALEFVAFGILFSPFVFICRQGLRFRTDLSTPEFSDACAASFQMTGQVGQQQAGYTDSRTRSSLQDGIMDLGQTGGTTRISPTWADPLAQLAWLVWQVHQSRQYRVISLLMMLDAID